MTEPTMITLLDAALLTPRHLVTLGLSVALSATLLMSACGDEDNDEDLRDDAPQDAPDNTPDDDAREDLPAIAGASVSFDLNADVSRAASFYAMPYPSDLRLDAQGRPELRGFPEPGKQSTQDMLATAQDRPGWPATPAAFFQFDAALSQQDPETPFEATLDSPVLLIDIDPSSPERGALYPCAAATPSPDPYVPEHMLAVGAYPGVVLPAGRTYAFVVRRSLGDADGQLLGVPSALTTMAADQTPSGTAGADARALLEPLWETLDTLGLPRGEVAAATVLSVGDVVQETFDLSEQVLAEFDVVVDDLRLDPTDGEDHERFCEVHGTVTMPQFQLGTPIFTSGGQLARDDRGRLVKQRDAEVPIAFTIPRAPMPEGGYPLVIYIHGSAGLSTQLVDRGPILEPGGTATAGQGPAHVLAEHGLATLGQAMPVNPERVPGAGPYDYINIYNLGAFPYTFRQGVFETRLLIDAFDGLRIDPALLESCEGASLPDTQDAYFFDTSRLSAMGQSMGAQYVNLVAAVDPRVTAIAPTGAGGHWSKFMTVTPLAISDDGEPGEVLAIAAGLLGLGDEVENLSYLHPVLHLLQTAWEPGDALSSLPRIAARPLAGHPARHIYQPVAPGDVFFPTRIFDAMTLGFGAEQAGDVLWQSMQDDLALVGRDGILTYPVQGNRRSEDGEAYTAVVVQYEGDGIANPHTIFSQLDEIKFQYGCFFARWMLNGDSAVPAPAQLGSGCAP